MSLHVLDTEPLTLLQFGDPQISRRVARRRPEELSVTVISVEEQLFKKLKLGISAKDLRIGAIALEHNAAVATRNTRDFQRIPGLLVEDWSQ